MNKNVLIAILVIIFVFIYYIYIGWVISDVWLWFIVPLGMNPIGIVHSIGIGLFAGLLKGVAFIPKEKDDRAQMISMVLSPIIVWIFGYFLTNYYGI